MPLPTALFSFSAFYLPSNWPNELPDGLIKPLQVDHAVVFVFEVMAMKNDFPAVQNVLITCTFRRVQPK
jgi:hypothetical protein